MLRSVSSCPTSSIVYAPCRAELLTVHVCQDRAAAKLRREEAEAAQPQTKKDLKAAAKAEKQREKEMAKVLKQEQKVAKQEAKGSKKKRKDESIAETPAPSAAEPEAGPQLGVVHIGLGRIQYKGKGSFTPVLLALDVVSDDAGGVVPQLSVKSTENGKVLRTVNVSGCTLSEPKKSRKGQEHAFRLDVPSKDSKGDQKHVISLDAADQLAQWTEALRKF